MSHGSPHAGWHSRGYLPHLDAPGELQALTFRLADSVPAKVVESWKRELWNHAEASIELRKRITRYEDTGMGACYLRHPEHAEVVQACLLRGDGNRYRLLEWCIMPNHVHVLRMANMGMPLGDVVRTLKTYSARAINETLQRSGTLWSKDYHDRYIRDLGHLEAAKAYIRANPVKAGLCRHPEDWPWSSAGFRG